MSEKLCPICGGKKIYSPSREEERGWLCNKCGSEFFDTDMNNTFWQRRITELEAENARLKSEIVSKDKKVTDYEKELRQLHKYDKTCSTCRYLDENQNCVFGIRCINYALWQGRIL